MVISIRVTGEELKMLETLVEQTKARMEAQGLPPNVTAAGLFRLWLHEKAKMMGTSEILPASIPVAPASKGCRWLSPQEVSEELGIRRTTVYDIVNAGLLPASKVSPRRIVVDREDLDRYVVAAVIVPKSKTSRYQQRVETMTNEELHEELRKHGC